MLFLLFAHLANLEITIILSLVLFKLYSYHLLHFSFEARHKGSSLFIEISSLLFEALVEYVVFLALSSFQNYYSFAFCEFYYNFDQTVFQAFFCSPGNQRNPTFKADSIGEKEP